MEAVSEWQGVGAPYPKCGVVAAGRHVRVSKIQSTIIEEYIL